MTPWLRYLIAFIVFCHGFVYVRIGSMLPAPVPAWTGTSWLLGHALTGSRLNTIIVGLHVIAGIATIGCALAIAFAPSAAGWWRPLAIAGGVFGVAAFTVFWDGQTRLLFDEGGLGAVLSVILLATAILFPDAFR